jgi:hypothetical protein
MRVFRSLLVSGSAVLAVGSLGLAVGTTASSTAASGRMAHATAAHPSAKFISEARASLVRYLNHTHPGALLAHTGGVKASANGTTKSESFNWGGYANTSTKAQAFSKVSGNWTTPKIAVKCSPEDELTSEWVGIDGFGTNTVEQDGTLDWCFEGKAIYFTWYEMFPAGTVEVGASLKPGDKISASVVRSGTSYTLAVTDHNNKKDSFTHKATCAASTCLDESAEWIAERPAFSIGIAPLVDYGKWNLTSGAVTEGGKAGKIGTFANDSIAMIDATESYDLSTVSGLTGGNSFTTTWKNSY